MVGHAMDRGGLKDSKNASNYFFPKINRTGFWRFGTDMLVLKEMESTPHYTTVQNSMFALVGLPTSSTVQPTSGTIPSWKSATGKTW